MSKEYATFVSDPQILPEGKEIKLAVKDLTPGPRKYDCRIVTAVVASSPGKLKGADVLWFRSRVGALLPQPWAIKITGELGDSLPYPPYQSVEEVNKILNGW